MSYYGMPYVYPTYGFGPQTTAQQMMMQQPMIMQQPQQMMQQPPQQMMQQTQQAPVMQPVSQATSGRIDFSGAVVNNFDDVKEYPVPVGGLIFLINKKDKKFYIKSMNDNGVPVIETYTFDTAGVEENQAEEEIDLKSIAKRMDAIERQLRIE